MNWTGYRLARAAAVLAIAGGAAVAAPTSAAALPFTLETHCYPDLGTETGNQISFPCYSQVQGGAAPYTFDWSRSKGVAISPIHGQTITATCSAGQLIRFDELAWDANAQVREWNPGWQYCPFT